MRTVNEEARRAKTIEIMEKCFDCYAENGFTEGCNNKIKIFKRNAYGYKNFRRFRNHILHLFSHKQQNKEQAAA